MNAVTFDSLSVHFGRRAALESVSASIAAGVVTGIVGPNGAGKTTLLRAALGLQSLSQGTIRILDKPLGSWPREGLARAMAYLPQGGEARWPMLAGDVVLLGRLPHRAAFSAPDLKDRMAVADARARWQPAVLAAGRWD